LEDIKPEDLVCHFSGWPLTLEVRWYKDDKIIRNGTEGIYHSEVEKEKNGEKIMLTRLTLPLGREELEGAYKYSAKNTISGRRASQTLQYIYKCKQKPKPTYNLAYGG